MTENVKIRQHQSEVLGILFVLHNYGDVPFEFVYNLQRRHMFSLILLTPRIFVVVARWPSNNKKKSEGYEYQTIIYDWTIKSYLILWLVGSEYREFNLFLVGSEYRENLVSSDLNI